MTFRTNGNHAQLGGQGQAEAPEDLLRAMVQRLVHETIQTEFNDFVGAGPYERNGARRGWRNGYKPRTYRTRVGKLVLRIPQDREGRFQPSLFERYERSEKALIAAVIEWALPGLTPTSVTLVQGANGWRVAIGEFTAPAHAGYDMRGHFLLVPDSERSVLVAIQQPVHVPMEEIAIHSAAGDWYLPTSEFTFKPVK